MLNEEPMTKEELLARLNTDVITDIVCASQVDGGYIEFSIELRMFSGRVYAFTHSAATAPTFRQAEVLCFTDGDCSHVLELGECYDPSTYFPINGEQPTEDPDTTSPETNASIEQGD
jgi:hypothetical protein